jgi:hypothetical protein
LSTPLPEDKVRLLFTNAHQTFRIIQLIRDNSDIIKHVAELTDAIAAGSGYAKTGKDLTEFLEGNGPVAEEARNKLGQELIVPLLEQKLKDAKVADLYPELAKDTASRAKVAQELAGIIWGPDSWYVQYIVRLTHPVKTRTKVYLDDDQLRLRLEEDAYWRGKFSDWEILRIRPRQTRTVKVPGKDGKEIETEQCTPEPVTPDGVRYQNLDDIRDMKPFQPVH